MELAELGYQMRHVITRGLGNCMPFTEEVGTHYEKQAGGTG